MAVNIVLKGSDIFINRVPVPKHVVETVNYMARRCPLLVAVLPEFITAMTPGLDQDEAECLLEAITLSMRGTQDRFSLNSEVLNALACGYRVKK